AKLNSAVQPPTMQLSRILRQFEPEILQEWLARQKLSAMHGSAPTDEETLSSRAKEFLTLLAAASQSGDNVNGDDWAEVRRFLSDFSSARAKEGFSPSETALFIFSLKEPVFNR